MTVATNQYFKIKKNMPKYVCTQLENIQGETHCTAWVEYQNSIDMLAITEQQANEITIHIVIAILSAWSIKQIINLIQGRRY